jgi:hypothetical protein
MGAETGDANLPAIVDDNKAGERRDRTRLGPIQTSQLGRISMHNCFARRSKGKQTNKAEMRIWNSP